MAKLEVELDETIAAPMCACEACARRADVIERLTMSGAITVTTRFSLDDARVGCVAPWTAIVRAGDGHAAIAAGHTEDDAVLEALGRIG